MLTTRSVKYITLFSLLLIAGLVLGNRILIIMSLVPMGLIVLGVFISPPGRFQMVDSSVPERAWVGDIIELHFSIVVPAGFGTFTLHQDVPPHFSLEKGSNFRLFWKGWRERKVEFSFTVRCSKRGNYVFLPLKYQSRHVIWMRPSLEDTLGELHTLAVYHRIYNVRNIRGIPGQAESPFPTIDIAKIGVQTTDFREIRRYIAGDPIKNINWKATARLASPNPWPLTNEFEVEGKKSVWIFLDASRMLEVGTDIRNAFEYCLEAANSVLYYYSNRGYRVGLYVFNNQSELFYPDAGRKQFIKVSRQLLDIKPGTSFDEFPLAVEKCKRYILGYNPLCVIITRLDNRFASNIITGVKVLGRIKGPRRRKSPVMVVNIPGYAMVKGDTDIDDNAVLLMQLHSRPQAMQLRALGAVVLNWDPFKENLNAALLRSLRKR